MPSKSLEATRQLGEGGAIVEWEDKPEGWKPPRTRQVGIGQWVGGVGNVRKEDVARWITNHIASKYGLGMNQKAQLYATILDYLDFPENYPSARYCGSARRLVEDDIVRYAKARYFDVKTGARLEQFGFKLNKPPANDNSLPPEVVAPKAPEAPPPINVEIRSVPTPRQIKVATQDIPAQLSEKNLIKNFGYLLGYLTAKNQGLLPTEYYSYVVDPYVSGKVPKDMWLHQTVQHSKEEYNKEMKSRGIYDKYTFWVSLERGAPLFDDPKKSSARRSYAASRNPPPLRPFPRGGPLAVPSPRVFNPGAIYRRRLRWRR